MKPRHGAWTGWCAAISIMRKSAGSAASSTSMTEIGLKAAAPLSKMPRGLWRFFAGQTLNRDAPKDPRAGFRLWLPQPPRPRLYPRRSRRLEPGPFPGVAAHLKIMIVTDAASSDITGKSCSPYTAHWTYDTYGNAHTVGNAIVKNGGDTWFFITVDYAFGHAVERDTSDVVKAAGGKVLGSVKHPLNAADFSSLLLQAQASKAKIIGLANGGGDTINAIKQAGEFNLVAGGQNLAAIVMFIVDVHALGLKVAQGLIVTEAFYWDLNDKTRALGKRFLERANRMPPMVNAGTYSATLHYLKAVQAAGTRDAKTVMAKMREMPVRDALLIGVERELFERRPVLFDAVRKRVATEHVAHAARVGRQPGQRIA